MRGLTVRLNWDSNAKVDAASKPGTTCCRLVGPTDGRSERSCKSTEGAGELTRSRQSMFKVRPPHRRFAALAGMIFVLAMLIAAGAMGADGASSEDMAIPSSESVLEAI